jgi:hypothetical protein
MSPQSVAGSVALNADRKSKINTTVAPSSDDSVAQPGIAADRLGREIARILKASSSALAAAECQAVGRALLVSTKGLSSYDRTEKL